MRETAVSSERSRPPKRASALRADERTSRLLRNLLGAVHRACGRTGVFRCGQVDAPSLPIPGTMSVAPKIRLAVQRRSHDCCVEPVASPGYATGLVYVRRHDGEDAEVV